MRANGTFVFQQATSPMELWGQQRERVIWEAWRFVDIIAATKQCLNLMEIWSQIRRLTFCLELNSFEILNIHFKFKRYATNQMRTKSKLETDFCLCSASQDFSMDFGHCPEITVYTGCCLFPPADQLATIWAENKKALLSMLVEVKLFYSITWDILFWLV